ELSEPDQSNAGNTDWRSLRLTVFSNRACTGCPPRAGARELPAAVSENRSDRHADSDDGGDADVEPCRTINDEDREKSDADYCSPPHGMVGNPPICSVRPPHG